MLQNPKVFVPGVQTQPFFDPRGLNVSFSDEEIDRIRTEGFQLLESRRLMLDCESPELATVGQWNSVEIIRRGNQRLDISKTAPTIFDQCVRPALALGFGSVFLSVLQPGTRIAPHYGLTNVKLRCLLQLTNSPAKLTVFREERAVTEGCPIVIDDSIVHWVQYPLNSDGPRVCLAWDIAHPSASAECLEIARARLQSYMYGGPS